MSENPEDWRSAVDKASGRTYWYHRKTRVSTWVKPNFFEVLSSDQETASIQQPNSNPQISTVRNQVVEQTFATTLASVARSPSSAIPADVDRLLTDVIAKKASDPNDAGAYLSGLSTIVVQSCGEGSSISSVHARRTALKCLWTLSTFDQHRFAAEHFYINQAWTALPQYAANWAATNRSSEDIESVLLLVALVSNLLVGPTYYLIVPDSKEQLSDVLLQVRTASLSLRWDLLLGPAGAEVLTPRTVQTFGMLAEKGHSLPALWLVVVFTHALRSDTAYTAVMKLGALEVLLQISANTRLDQTTRSAAKESLIAAMTSSSYARERVLEAFIELSGDLASIPVPLGPDPALYATADPASASATTGAADEGANSDAEHDQEVDADGVAEESPAQAKYAAVVASGCCEVVVLSDRDASAAREGGEEGEEGVEEGGDAWSAFNRDVEWIPKAGTPWRLSSAVLWARCPALRDLISGFWDEGGGGLELSIDASDEVLACLCRYLHSGLLCLPLRLSRRLQLLRVASELGMEGLFHLASQGVQTFLTLDNVAAVLSFTIEHGFHDLERACRAFVSGGGKTANPFRLDSAASRMDSGSASLREAIASSLKDVNAVLGQHPPPAAAKLKVEPRVAATASIPTATSTAAPAQATTTSKIPQRAAQTNTSLLRELDDHPDDAADPYDLSNLSLMDIASGRAALSRENSYSADANTKYADVSAEYSEDYDFNEYTQSALQSAYGAKGYSSAGNKGSKGKGKAGSGGIYGLLLQSSEEAQLYEGPNAVVGGGVRQVPSNKVPGRVAGEKRTVPQSAGVNKGLPAAQKTGSAAAEVESTPRTQRATSLLANARPSQYSEYDQHEGGWDDGSVNSANIRRVGGPQEFEKKMSLAPPRAMTPNEKRLERLTRPTRALELRSSGADKSREEDEEDDEAGAVAAAGEPDPAAEDEAGNTPTLRPAAAASPKPQPERSTAPLKARGTAARTTSSAGGAATESQKPAAAEGPSGSLVLKRSVSPSTTTSQSSREGYLVSIGSTLPVTATAQSPTPTTNAGADFNVRGSLTLLKTKAASSRRRRSVADIEGAQQGGSAEGQADDVASSAAPATPAATSSAPTRSAAATVPTARNAPAHVTLDLTSYLADEDAEAAEADQRGYDHGDDDGGDYGDAGDDAGQQVMQQCPTCGRRFNQTAFGRHAPHCSKTFGKQRKKFDSAKMRIEHNADLKEFVEHGGADNSGGGGAVSRPGTAKKTGKPTVERRPSAKDVGATATQDAASGSKWKDQSAAFREAMRNAREYAAAKASGGPLPPSMPSAPDPNLVPCPHCDRRFNKKAAERHIPVCQSIRAKPAALKRGGGGTASNGGGALANTSGKVNRGWQ